MLQLVPLLPKVVASGVFFFRSFTMCCSPGLTDHAVGGEERSEKDDREEE